MTADDPASRARLVRERLARLRAHETETRNRLHAAALRDLLDAGYTEMMDSAPAPA